MDNNLIARLFARINDAIDYKLSMQTHIKSAVVHSINHDGTVNLQIPPGSTVYHNIQNQSIYRNLKSGDNVKVIVENGNLSNMWIIGGFNLSNSIDVIYPVGSIYISVNDTNPGDVFGGVWKRIKDRFILAAGDTYAAGATGGEASHTLTTSEMPAHWHQVLTRWNDGTYRVKYYRTNATSGSAWHLFNFDSTTSSLEYQDSDAYAATEGENKPHNNMPPYLAVYMWERVQ